MIEFPKMKTNPVRIFVITTVFYVMLSVMPNKMSAAVCILGYLGILFWYLRDIFLTLGVAYMALVPLSVGKFFPIDLVRAQQMHLPWRLIGINADITVAARDGLVMAMGMLIMRERITQGVRTGVDKALMWLLCLMPFAFIVSAIAGSVRPGLSLLHALFFFEPCILYMFVTYGRKRWDYASIAAVIASGMLFVCAIAIAQYMSGHTLGLVVENFPGYTPLDEGADAGSMIRLGGTFAHANLLAQYLLFSLFTVLPVVFMRKHPVEHIAALAVVFGVVVLCLTQSRTAWIAGVAGALVFGTYMHARTSGVFQMSSIVRHIVYFSMPIVCVLGVFIVMPRIIHTAYTLEPNGGTAVRISLFQDAWDVIRSHPWVGVGMKMDVYTLYERFGIQPAPFMHYPEPVHNGFIQLLMQTGMLGFVPYLILMGVVGNRLWNMLRRARGEIQGYCIGVVAACVAVVVNSQLQPLLPDIQHIVFLIAVLESARQTSRRSWRRG